METKETTENSNCLIELDQDQAFEVAQALIARLEALQKEQKVLASLREKAEQEDAPECVIMSFRLGQGAMAEQQLCIQKVIAMVTNS